MKLSPARRAALAFLEGEYWLRDGDWDERLAKALDAPALADPRDRRLFSQLVAGSVRLRGRLDARLLRLTGRARLDAAVQAALRLALFQLEELDRVPVHAVVGESVEWVRRRRGARLAGWTNAQLRAYLRDGLPGADPDPATDPLGHAVATLSYPPWLAARWLAELGAQRAFAVMAAMNRRAGTCFRWNPLRDGRDEFLAALVAEGAAVSRPEGLPLAFRVDGGWLPALRLGLEGGLISVQDESAQRVALLLAPAPGKAYADLCAAPGGKCCQIAELAGDGGAGVLALDRSATRLEKVVANAARLGLSRLRSEEGDLARREPEPADGVLLDAPCSALGVLADNPDARWRQTEADVSRLATGQRRLLAAAADWVKPGGLLVYSVCTLTPEETTAQRAWFLAERPDFAAEPVSAAEAPPGCVGESGELVVWPDAGDGAGAYAVRFRREEH